jgi:hypothetical protein
MEIPMIKRLLLAVAFSFAIVPTSVFAASVEQIEWTPNEINYTIGNGQGASDPVVATFTSPTSLERITLEVVPGLSRFVAVEPAVISKVEAGVPYSVALRFSLPPGAEPGKYEGVIHIRSGKRTLPQTLKVIVNVEFGQNQIRSTTSVLSSETTHFLSFVSPDRSTLVFSQKTSELANLQPGSVMVIGSSDTLPTGFIGRIVTISDNAPVIITTIPATISDALSSIDLALSRTLSEADLSSPPNTSTLIANSAIARPAPEISATSSGFFLQFNHVPLFDAGNGLKVTLDGSITVNPSFDVQFGMQGFTVTRFRFVDTTTFQANLSVFCGLTGNVSRKFDLAHYNFTPIIVWAGPVPVVFTPELVITVGIDGTASVGLTMAATQDASMSVGLQYDGNWAPISEFSNSFTFQTPTPAASADPKVFAGPQLNLLVYGIVGPFATIRPFIELDIDLFRNPQYELFGGLEAAAGVHLQFLTTTLGDHEFPTLIGFRKTLTQGNFGSQVLLGTDLPTSNTGAEIAVLFSQSLAQNFTLTSPVSIDAIKLQMSGFGIDQFTLRLTNSIGAGTTQANVLLQRNLTFPNTGGGVSGSTVSVPVNLSLPPGNYFIVLSSTQGSARQGWLVSTATLPSAVGSVGDFRFSLPNDPSFPPASTFIPVGFGPAAFQLIP